MTRITLRGFVQGTLAAGATMLLPHSRVWGANDQIRIAVVGFHIRGKRLMDRFSDVPGVRVAALCDVDVVLGILQEPQQDVLDVLADVARLRKRRRGSNGEGHVKRA